MNTNFLYFGSKEYIGIAYDLKTNDCIYKETYLKIYYQYFEISDVYDENNKAYKVKMIFVY